MTRHARTALIIGAGPAGLTAAYELVTRSDIHPIVIEADPEYVGGISRTVNYKGNRIDIGGHRFFSKSDRVMRWWSEMLPVRIDEGVSQAITYQRTTKALTEGLRRAAPEDGDNVMLVRPRKTRILYGGTFFAYPIELSVGTLMKLGPLKVVKIGVTYLTSILFPIRPEKTLEDFFINRFGRELYETFFKSYTEKVWGQACSAMSAAWGAQRVKGLSIAKAVRHAVGKLLKNPLAGKRVETSLIEQFLYPTYGPGQMWETVARKVHEKGGEIHMGARVIGISHDGSRVKSIRVETNEGIRDYHPDYVFSTTDVRSLAQMFSPALPADVRTIAEGLQFRDFFTVGLLLVKPLAEGEEPLRDTWMYVHEPGVFVGRVQFFNNWSPHLVADARQGWVGLEYFCNEGDALWKKSDAELIALGSDELERIGLRKGIPVVDGVVVRQQKTYPGYFGSYERFDELRRCLDTFENLFLIGRNGMHRYNNQDHSMLAAMTVVDSLLEEGSPRRAWEVNTEEEYHEEK